MFKCIVCQKEAEYIIWGDSVCEKHYIQFKKIFNMKGIEDEIN